MSKLELNQTLGEYLKDREREFRQYVDKTKPVFLRLDGKNFSKLTRNIEKPICTIFRKTMRDTLEYLLNNIQSAVVGYQQSDEITIMIDNYSKEDSEPWFGGQIQKIDSIASSMATLIFSKQFIRNIETELQSENLSEERAAYLYKLIDFYNSEKFLPIFDCRVFQVPLDEAIKPLKWRQLDMAKNSVTGYAQQYFSHKQLDGINTNTRKEMLLECGLNWDELPFDDKYGFVMSLQKNESGRQKFVETPILFTKNIDIYEYIQKRTSFQD